MPDFVSLEQAAQWYAVLRDEDATPQEREGWQHWMAQRAENAAAWQHVEAVGRRFEPLQQDARHAASAGLQAARQTSAPLSRRKALNGLTAIAGIGMGGWLLARHTSLPDMVMAWAADHHTGVGEVRQLVLSDGTRVWLNTSSALNVDYQPMLRRVALVAGEVMIETGKDPAARPFVVDTAQGRLRALGTRFTVRQEAAQSLVAVYEGAVEIRTGTTGAVAVVNASLQTAFTAGQIAPLQPAERARQAWTRGLLLADDMRLAALIAELGRYRSGHLGVAPEVAELRVMGAYPLQDTDRALAMLEQALPIRVRRVLPWWTTLESR